MQKLYGSVLLVFTILFWNCTILRFLVYHSVVPIVHYSMLELSDCLLLVYHSMQKLSHSVLPSVHYFKLEMSDYVILVRHSVQKLSHFVQKLYHSVLELYPFVLVLGKLP